MVQLCSRSLTYAKTMFFALLFSRLTPSLDKIGGGPEGQILKTTFFTLLFSRLAPSLDKIGGGSEVQI